MKASSAPSQEGDGILALRPIRRDDDHKAETTEPSLRWILLSPLSISTIFLGMLDIRECVSSSVVSKAYHKCVDSFFQQSQLRFLRFQREEKQKIKNAEEKKQEKLQQQETDMTGRRALLEKLHENKVERLRVEHLLALVQLATKEGEFKKAVEEEYQKTLAEIQSNAKANTQDISFIQSQIVQLTRFLSDAKEEKENKPWFSQRIMRRSGFNPAYRILMVLTILSLECSMMGFFLLLHYPAKLSSFGLMLFPAAWPLALGGLGIGVCSLLMIYCIKNFSFDRRGPERFDDVLLLSFSKKIQQDLDAIENTFLPLACFTVHAMPEVSQDSLNLEKKTENQEPLDKIYVKAKDGVLTYQIFDVTRSVVLAELIKIVGQQKINEMLDALENKLESTNLGQYKKDILKIISSAGDIPPNPFASIDNTTTLGDACKIVKEQHELLLAKLSVFRPKKLMADVNAADPSLLLSGSTTTPQSSVA